MKIIETNIEEEDKIISIDYKTNNRLVDYFIEFYPTGFGKSADVYVNSLKIEVDDFDMIIEEEDIIDVVLRPDYPLAGKILLMTVLSAVISYIMSPQLPNMDPVKKINSGQRVTGSSVYNLNDNGNNTNLNGIIPVCYGTTRMYYDQIMENYRNFIGLKEYSYNLFMVGQGEYTVDKLQINTTDVTDHKDVKYCLIKPEDLGDIKGKILSELNIDIPSTQISVLDNPTNYELNNGYNSGNFSFRYKVDSYGVPIVYVTFYDSIYPVEDTFANGSTLFINFNDMTAKEQGTNSKWEVELLVITKYSDYSLKTILVDGYIPRAYSWGYYGVIDSGGWGNPMGYSHKAVDIVSVEDLGDGLHEFLINQEQNMAFEIYEGYEQYIKTPGFFPITDDDVFFDGQNIDLAMVDTNGDSHYIPYVVKDMLYNEDDYGFGHIYRMKLQRLRSTDAPIPNLASIVRFNMRSQFIEINTQVKTNDFSIINKKGIPANKLEFNMSFPRGLYYSEGGKRVPDDKTKFILTLKNGNTIVDEIESTFLGSVYDNYIKSQIVDIPAGVTSFSVKRMSYQSRSDNDMSDCMIQSINAIYDDFSHTDYGDVTLLFTRVKASDAFKEHSLLKINGWNTRTDVSNDVEAVTQDIFTNDSYGIGLTNENLIINNLDTLDEVNGAYTSSMTSYDAIKMYSDSLKYIVSTEGNNLILTKDIPQTIPTILFNEYSIVEESLSVNYKFEEEIKEFDCIASSYRNDHFETDYEYYPSKLLNPLKFETFGIISSAVALDMAKYKFNQHKYRRKFIKFQTDIEGYIPKLNDLIIVSHKLSNITGDSGVFTRNGDTLTLDTKVTNDGTINLKQKNGVPITKSYTRVSDYIITVDLGENVVTDVYSLGVPVHFVITKIAPTKDSISIEAVKYDDRLYV